MAANLNIQFVDSPLGATSSNLGSVAALLSQAFAAWTQHFDYTAGTYTVDVSFKAATQPPDLSVDLGSSTVVTEQKFPARVEPSFGLAVAGRAYDPGSGTAPTFFVNPAYATGSRSVASLLGPAERYFGQALGVYSVGLLLYGEPILYSQLTVFEKYASYIQGSSPIQGAYYGPNAQAAYGGPVPSVVNMAYLMAAPGFVAVDSSIQPAASLQPLDVALLRDAGLPVLSDQEVGEHEIARLYLAAFGRNADSAGLIGNYDALLSGESMAQVGNGLVGSAEFAQRYGNPSNAAFANTLYENALGRAPTGAESQFVQNALAAGASRGALVAAFADSDESRGHLNGNPNVTYAGTAEAQVARLYDAAFGRDADPAGFVSDTHALITGETLGQLATTFIAAQEFANRYGAAPSDQALVDGLYATALHRAPNTAEEGFYVRLLGAGQITRSDLLVAVSESPEHVNRVAQQASARDAAGYNVDIGAHLGIIPTISAPTLT